MLNERISALLAGRGSSKGFFFGAFSDGRVIDFCKVDYWDESEVFGFNDDGNYAYMSLPSSLVGDGPHEVESPTSHDYWRLVVEGHPYFFKGSATFTYRNDRNIIYGAFDCELTGGSGVRLVGGFYITND
jgi:hypothetical protein